MKENQTAIYYALGDTVQAIEASPHLEGYRARHIEVLYLSDPVDAFWVRTALGYQGKPFKSITQGSDDLDTIKQATAEESRTEGEAAEKDITALFSFWKETLGDAVSSVRASSRLAESPVCLVASEGALDKQLEKILKDQSGTAFNPAPVLEINAKHAMIRKLAGFITNQENRHVAESMATLLYGQARILDGEQPDDPSKFVKALSLFLEKAID